MRKLLFFLFILVISKTCLGLPVGLKAGVRLPDYVRSLESLPPDSGLLESAHVKVENTPVKTVAQKAPVIRQSPKAPDESKNRPTLNEILILVSKHSEEIDELYSNISELFKNNDALKKELSTFIKDLKDKMEMIVSTFPVNTSAKLPVESGLFSKVGGKLDMFLDKKVIATIIILVIVYQAYIYINNKKSVVANAMPDKKE